MFYWTNTVINDKPITNITHSGGLISFDFMGGSTSFVPVANIINVPAAAIVALPLTLSGTVVPSDASNQTITWSIANAGTTGATISGSNILNVTGAGTVTVRATILNGASPTTSYIQDFPITVTLAVLSGSVTITGNLVFGQTLTANTTALSSTPVIPNLGTKSYQWIRGTTNIPGAINPTYMLVQADIGETICVQVFASNCSGSVTACTSGIVTKASQTAPPAPILENSTTTSITLETVAGCEYKIDDEVYQELPVFNDLTPGTSYTFIQRKAETATHFASPPSQPATFSTPTEFFSVINIAGVPTTATATIPLTLTGSVVPENATNQTIIWSVQDAGATGATITNVNILNTLAAGMVIVFATIENGVSPTTDYTQPFTITVNKTIQVPPNAPTLANANTNSITLNQVEGCEYNMDGGEYQTALLFAGLLPNTSYTFTQRYVETETFLVSEPSPSAQFSTEPIIGIGDNEFNNIHVYSYSNSVYIKNESEITLKVVEITDMLGRQVYQSVIASNETVITLDVANGIYGVRLILQDDSLVIRKVSIQK
jgi:hypothetical protein